MKRVILVGELGEKFGKEFNLSISTSAEAIRALAANFRGFEKYIADCGEKGIGFKILVGNDHINKNEELFYPVGKSDISIVPVIAGGGSAAERIFVGAALIGLSFTPLGAFELGASATLGGLFFGVGSALALGGVVQLLSPPPRVESPNEPADNTPSYYFGGPVNTTAQGEPVPICYGTVLVGSQIISAGIIAQDITV